MRESPPSESTRLLASPSVPKASLSSSTSALQYVLAAATIQLLLSIGSYIALVPQTLILQDIICEDYYAHMYLHNGTIPLDKCKVEPVQSEMAYVTGWQQAFETIPAMLLAIPYGALADRVGRKKILLLAIIGLFMNDAWIRVVYWFHDFFPVRIVWLAGLWQVLGAGAATLSSLTYVLVADACSAEQRTTAFSQIKSARLLSQLIFVPLGGALIQLSPWVPMLISSGFMVAGFLATLFLVPETFPLDTGNSGSNDGQRLLVGELHSETSQRNLLLRMQEHVASVTELGHWVVKNVQVVPLVASFFVFQLGEQAGSTLLLQYASKRLGWSMGKASYLISIRAGVNIIVLAVLVPAISIFLLRHLHLTAMAKDKGIAQASGTFLVLGSSAIFFATAPTAMIVGQVMSSLGDVFSLPVRSLATSMVEQNYLATSYTVIEVLTQLGLFAGQPLLASAFRRGMQLGQFWMGLPFLVAAGCFLIALLAVSTCPVGIGGQETRDDGVSGTSEDGTTSNE